MTATDSLLAPWPCPSCGGPLVWGAVYVYPEAFEGLVCRREDKVYREGRP